MPLVRLTDSLVRSIVSLLYDLFQRLDVEHEIDVLQYGKTSHARAHRKRILARLATCRKAILELEDRLHDCQKSNGG